jgi:hypothetical protein
MAEKTTVEDLLETLPKLGVNAIRLGGGADPKSFRGTAQRCRPSSLSGGSIKAPPG